MFRLGPPTVTRPVPLKPWLLALNDPETPAGDVRGLGLGNRIVCIGVSERASVRANGGRVSKSVL